jgi:hypothetical protein
MQMAGDPVRPHGERGCSKIPLRRTRTLRKRRVCGNSSSSDCCEAAGQPEELASVFFHERLARTPSSDLRTAPSRRTDRTRPVKGPSGSPGGERARHARAVRAGFDLPIRRPSPTRSSGGLRDGGGPEPDSDVRGARAALKQATANYPRSRPAGEITDAEYDEVMAELAEDPEPGRAIAEGPSSGTRADGCRGRMTRTGSLTAAWPPAVTFEESQHGRISARC